MNKTSIIALVVVCLLVAAGVGYAIWSNFNSPQATPTTTTTTNTTPVSVSQPGSPIVQTNSSATSYNSAVAVSGTVNPNGAATTYWFEYGETQALGSQISGYLIGSGYVTLYTPAYITGLKSNTNYYFRLTAKNSIGTVSGTTYSFKTSTAPAPAGIAPAANTSSATNIERTSVNLHGQINPKNSDTRYWFEYGSTSNLGAVTAFQSAGSANFSSDVVVTIPNLQPLTRYYFRINAQNQFGTANGQILNFTTTGPVASTAPTVNTNSVNAITSSSAKLNASVNPNGVAITYWFEYSKNSLLSNVVALTTPEQSLTIGNLTTNVLANISSLNNNTKYYVRAVAKNQYGTVKGDMVSFTTKR